MESIPVFWNGILYVWKPYPGLDPSLMSKHLLIGARMYAQCISEGMSERDAHIAAEKVAYENFYDVTY